MTRSGRFLRTVVIGLLAAPGHAGIRSDAAAGLGLVEDDPREALSLFELGNPAGLATGERRSRLDLQLGAALNSETATNGLREVAHADGAARLTGPAGPWEGVTLYPGDRDAVRIAVPAQGGFAFASSKAPGREDAGLGHFAADLGIDLMWARRIAPSFALGARARPSYGRIFFPTGGAIVSDRGTYGLLDYGAGAEFLLPAPAGERRELGVTYAPYDDAPDPLDLLGAFGISVVGSGGLGGYSIERTIRLSGGFSQTFRAEPTGTILGVQGRWAREGGFDLAATVDLTAAQTNQTTRTEAGLPGIPPVEESGLSLTLRRTRYRFEARVPFGDHDGRRWVAGAAVIGGSGRVDQYDFPISNTVILARDAVQGATAVAVARERPGRWRIGLGLEALSDRTTWRDPAAPAATPGIQRGSGGIVRLGGERHLGRRWAVRGGLAFHGESTTDNDPATPGPGTPDNPKRNETSLTLGGGWQGEKTSWDLLLALRPRAHDPPPEPPRTFTAAKLELRLACSRVW